MNVEVQKNFLTAEEFPEGSYGSAIHRNKLVKNKETPWRDGQQYYSAYTYEFRELHLDTPRRMAGAHPIHSEENNDYDKHSEMSSSKEVEEKEQDSLQLD